MKKLLILAFAIFILFLSACGSLVGTSSPSSSSASPGTPAATASVQTVCQVLHNRQAQLKQEYQSASAQLSAAQAQGNLQQAGEAEKTLVRLKQSIAQVQTQLKAC